MVLCRDFERSSRIWYSVGFKNWMTRHCISMATLSFSCLLMVLNPLFAPHVAGSALPSGSTVGIKCMLGNDTSCPAHHCCVKKVITFRDPSKEAIVGTECQPLLAEGTMCLRNPEDYMCSCLPGMKCALAKFETMGHCRPHG